MIDAIRSLETHRGTPEEVTESAQALYGAVAPQGFPFLDRIRACAGGEQKEMMSFMWYMSNSTPQKGEARFRVLKEKIWILWHHEMITVVVFNPRLPTLIAIPPNQFAQMHIDGNDGEKYSGNILVNWIK